MNENIGIVLGEAMGEVLEVDTSDNQLAQEKWGYGNCSCYIILKFSLKLFLSLFHINAKVNGDMAEDTWRFIRFYDHYQTHKGTET